MTKPAVIYPNGQGGHWLANLFYGLETGQFEIQQPPHNEFNLHPRTGNFRVGHANVFSDTDIAGSFVGIKSQFIAYLNSYYKWYSRTPQHNSSSELEVFFLLSDNACWRMNKDKLIQREYYDYQVIDADQMFLNQELFSQQVFNFLDHHHVQYQPNTVFVSAAIENFKNTSWALVDLDLSNNVPWLAWCHAICLIKKWRVPFTFADEFELAKVWLADKNADFINYTQQSFLTSL